MSSNLWLPINIQFSKISLTSEKSEVRSQKPESLDSVLTAYFGLLSHSLVGAGSLVGLGRLELPTSSLSGTRSNHLSYRPNVGTRGGAGRDRTGDLLNANQALSQLSYSPIPGFSAGDGQAARLEPFFFEAS